MADARGVSLGEHPVGEHRAVDGLDLVRPRPVNVHHLQDVLRLDEGDLRAGSLVAYLYEGELVHLPDAQQQILVEERLL